MKKNILGFILLGIAFVILILGLVMLKTKYSDYAIITYVAAAILGFVGIYYIITNSNPKAAYESEVRSILNTYDSVLVQSNTVPNLDGRNIVYIGSIDDLIDAQLEIRKPICYIKQSESCSFILLDEKEAFVHIMKLGPEVLSPLEIAIKENDLKVKNKSDMDAEMLKEIERTTIVKLSNQKSYKVSPIRKKEKDEVTVDPPVVDLTKKDEASIEEIKEEKKKENKKKDYYETPVIKPVKEEKREDDIEVLI